MMGPMYHSENDDKHYPPRGGRLRKFHSSNRILVGGRSPTRGHTEKNLSSVDVLMICFFSILFFLTFFHHMGISLWRGRRNVKHEHPSHSSNMKVRKHLVCSPEVVVLGLVDTVTNFKDPESI